MTRPLPPPATTAEFLLAAVVERLDQLNTALAELSGRLGTPPQPLSGQPEEGPMLLREPHAEPAGATVREPDVPEPPRRGKGSGREAWAAYADRLGVTYPHAAGQRDIIAAVDNARRAA